MRSFLVILLCVCVGLPAFGSTHYIAVLGTQPLFPATQSRAQFLAMLRQYPQREHQALALLGVDEAQFEKGMRSARNIVTQAPFHLDAMAYYDGRVKVVYDVAVPAHTYLWVIHMRHRTVYVPQVCGNISTVATTGIESFQSTPRPVARTTPPPVLSTPLPTPPPQVAQATPLATPLAAVVHHGFPWWIFLLPVALVAGNHSSSPTAAPGTPTPVPTLTPTPTPTPTGPPTATPTPTPTGPPTATPTPTPTPTKTPCPCPTPTKTPCPCPTPTPTPTPCPTHKPTPTPCPTATKTGR